MCKVKLDTAPEIVVQITLQALSRTAGRGAVITEAFDPLLYLLSGISKKTADKQGPAVSCQSPRVFIYVQHQPWTFHLCVAATEFREGPRWY